MRQIFFKDASAHLVDISDDGFVYQIFLSNSSGNGYRWKYKISGNDQLKMSGVYPTQEAGGVTVDYNVTNAKMSWTYPDGSIQTFKRLEPAWDSLASMIRPFVYQSELDMGVEGSHPDLVRNALKNGADPNERASMKHLPLKAAVLRAMPHQANHDLKNALAIVDLLLESGADPNSRIGSESESLLGETLSRVLRQRIPLNRNSPTTMAEHDHAMIQRLVDAGAAFNKHDRLEEIKTYANDQLTRKRISGYSREVLSYLEFYVALTESPPMLNR